MAFLFADKRASSHPEKWTRELMTSYLISGCFPLRLYSEKNREGETREIQDEQNKKLDWRKPGRGR